MRHDKATGSDWYGGDDHFAGAGGAVAVPHCGRLRSDLACACGNSPSIGCGLEKARLVMRLVLILLYMVSLGSFGFLIFHVGRFAVSDIQQFAQTLSVQGTWVLPPWLEGSSFQQTLVAWLPTPDKLFEAVTGERGQLVLPAVLGFTEGVGGVVSGTFLILFLSIYWSINQVHFERLWLSLLPAEQRKQARGIWRTIEPDLGAYIRSEIIQSLLAALLLGLGYWLLGSQYPVLLALIGALAWLIPVVGAPWQ